MDYPYPTINIRKIFATNSAKRENANELDDEMSEIEPLKAGENDRTYCF